MKHAAISVSCAGALAAAFLALSCSSDQAATAGAGGSSGDASVGGNSAGGAGGGSSGSGGTSTDAGPCTVNLSPSSDDHTTIQSALDNKVKTNGVVCFAPGTYKLQNHVELGAAAGVTFRGTGASRDDTVLDFTGQTTGEEGVLIDTDGFTIENLSIKNTAGNGIKVVGDNSTFRNIKVGWDHPGPGAGDAGPTSGAYAIYPTGAHTTLMEDNEVYGAADAGIYSGQCTHVIARRNNSHDNVLGIEIENTIGAEVYDNDVHGNVTGFLLDLLPNLQKTVATEYLVHDNHVHDNNLTNFAKANTLAAVAPQGTGVIILASKNVELTKNTIENNGGVAVLIVSYDIIDILTKINGGTASTPDPNTSRWPAHVYVHDNTYTNNGQDPQGTYAVFAAGPDGGKKTIPYDVLWDGILAPVDGGKGDSASAKICLGTAEQASFVNIHADTSLLDPKGWSTDTTPNQCTLPAVPPLTP